MKRIYALFIIIAFTATNIIYAQLSAPEVEDVYGGRILDITGYPLNSDSSRFFISTESANSIFYTDVYTNTSSPSPSRWTVLPAVDANAGYGSEINRIEAHALSGKLFFSHETGLLSVSPSSTTVDVVVSGRVEEIMIDDNNLYYLMGNQLHFGTLDSSGNFSEDSSSPITVSAIPARTVFFIHPVTGVLYYFTEGETPQLAKLDAAYTSSTTPASDIDISPTLTSTGVFWSTFGIAPDGRIFIMGTDGLEKYVAYSDDESIWTEYNMGIDGIIGPDVDFSGDSTSYWVYTSTVYSNNKGIAGSWHKFGNVSLETHPNDGPVFTDPINNTIVLLTSDQGIALSSDNGLNIQEIDDGIEAVQVEDFDMTDSKYTGWLASKSGIRKVSNYLTSPSWSNSIFPTDDGSPFHSVDMNPVDTNTVYAGNIRVYKTTDDGTSWDRVFTPEAAPYNFSSINTRCLAIEVLPEDPNVVFAGFDQRDSAKGGLFYSTDAGTTWDQILLEASSVGEDVDVTDIIFNVEGTDTVAYVSVEYDLSHPQGYSVYKLIKNGDNWTAAKDMTSSTTSVGYSIVVTITDLELSTTKDTVYAAGTDAGVNEPHVYYKPLNTTGLWTPLTTSGFSTTTTKVASAVTVGADTVFAAVDNEIYYYIMGSSSAWSLGYSYPKGSRINVLFYDELLVGTSTGFYGHSAILVTGIKKYDENNIPEEFVLSQNYPNPFNPSTKIKYSLPANASGENVTLEVFDVLGKKVATLINAKQSPGNYEFSFNANGLSSGIYFYRLKYGNYVDTKKMMLLK